MKSQLIAAFVVALLFGACAEAQDTPRTISVSGDAEVRVEPDEVIITLGVETVDMELAKAKSENDRLAAAVIAMAKMHDVEAKHIQTGHISIEPRYEYEYERRNFLGYFVRKTVVVTLRDLDEFEAFLSDALEAGTNYVHGIEFRTTELRKHRDEARRLALIAAKEKAEAMAGVLDQKIGQPRSIDEGYSQWFSPYSSWWGSFGGGRMAQNVVQNQGGGQGDSPTMPGQIAVNASVRVTFELVD